MSPLTKNEVGRLLNLDLFRKMFLSSERPPPQRKDVWNAFRLAADASRFESIVWLRLGTEIGFYSRDAAVELLNSRLDSLLPADPENWMIVESQFPTQGDLVHILRSSQQSTRISNIFGETKQGNSFQLGIFNSGLFLGASMAKDFPLLSFTATMNFSSDRFWSEEILTPIVDTDEVMRVLTNDWKTLDSFSPELVWAGLLRAITFMDRYQSILEGTGNPESIAEVRGKFKAAFGWRISVGTERDRFFALVEKVSRAVSVQLGEKVEPRRLVRIVEDLVRYWNGEGRVLTAGV